MKFDHEKFERAATLMKLSPVERQAVLGSEPAEIEDRMREAILICAAQFSLFRDRSDPEAWLRRPNNGLNLAGEPAIKLMVSGQIDDLRTLRRHLEYWAYNGW